MSATDHFERDKVSYEQNCEQMRSLNQTMWQVPIIGMTLTGGLWYAVGTLKEINDVVRLGLLFYSAVANIGLILVLIRVRDVIEACLQKMKSFNPPGFVDASHQQGGLVPRGNKVVCYTFCALMGLAAALNLAGIGLIVFGAWPAESPSTAYGAEDVIAL